MSNQSADAGSSGWKAGNLRRYLKPVVLASIGSAASTSAVKDYVLKLQGLSDVLTCHIAVGVVTSNPGNSQDPILPSQYPGSPGTMQLIPVVKNPELPRLYVREVFQDPTIVTNIDAPLPQEIPFGWSFEPEGADEVMIQVHVPANAWAATGIAGTLVCVVTVSYTGDWQDTQAVERALSAVQLVGDANDPNVIGSGGL